MENKLSDLIDIEKNQKLLDRFCDAVGIAAAIIDLKGQVLIGSRWQRICTDFHRVNKRTCEKCIESDTQLANELQQGKRFSIYQCRNGLTDAASPIIIEDEHIANIFVGQFFLKPPDHDFFIRQAVKYEFEEITYLDALSDVPIVTEAHLPAILNFLTTFAEMLAELGLDRLRQAEAGKALRASEEKYRSVFENAIEGFVQSTPEGRFISVNPAFASMLGYASPEDLISSISDIATQYYADPEDRRRYQQLLQKNRMVKDLEYKAKCKDGSHIWVSSSTRAISDQHGKIIRYEGVVEDITQQRRIEKEKEKLQNQLIQLQKMEAVGTLAGGIAHDFNNILGGMMGYAELAVEETPADKDKLQKYLSRILAAGDRARNLVGQILNFCRQDTSAQVGLALTPLVTECIKLLESVLPTTIIIDAHLEAADDTLLGDPNQIHQVVMNLGTNAYQAMRSKGGRLTVKLENLHLAQSRNFQGLVIEPGAYIKLSVTDTGPGIPANLQARIFNPFFTTKEVDEGTGLGLSVSFGIIKSHNGLIEIEQTSEAGTTFAIFLPVRDEHLRSSVAEVEPLESGNNEHILVVDDEPFFLDVLHEILTALNYRVTPVQSSLAALEKLRMDPDAFDLLLSDQTMPKLTGVQLAAKVKELNPWLPIILCTGYSENVTAETAANYGITKFLMKPVNQRDLARTVREVLNKSGE